MPQPLQEAKFHHPVGWRGPVSHCSPAKHYHRAQAAQQAAGVVNHIPHKPQNMTGGCVWRNPRRDAPHERSQSLCPRKGRSYGGPEAGIALLPAHSLMGWPGHGVPHGCPHSGEGAASLGTTLEGENQLNALQALHRSVDAEALVTWGLLSWKSISQGTGGL